jgi:hypothetical protein
MRWEGSVKADAKKEMIDQCVAAMVPELKIALDSVMSGEACHAFTALDAANTASGLKQKIVCFLAFEYFADILEGTARGVDTAQKNVQEAIRKAGGNIVGRAQ